MQSKLGIIKKSKPLSKTDLLICIAILAAAVFSAIFAVPKGGGSYAEIYCGGSLVKTMYLNVNDTYRYEYEGHYNIITVEGGKISVTGSDCEDGICRNYPSLNTAGGTIICLPNKLLIIVKGEYEGIDGVIKGKNYE